MTNAKDLYAELIDAVAGLIPKDQHAAFDAALGQDPDLAQWLKVASKFIPQDASPSANVGDDGATAASSEAPDFGAFSKMSMREKGEVLHNLIGTKSSSKESQAALSKRGADYLQSMVGKTHSEKQAIHAAAIRGETNGDE